MNERWAEEKKGFPNTCAGRFFAPHLDDEVFFLTGWLVWWVGWVLVGWSVGTTLLTTLFVFSSRRTGS
jgi:hypothetical protein